VIGDKIMKTRIKKIVQKVSLRHNVEGITITDDHLVHIKFSKINSILEKVLMIKDRTSGRRIQKPIINQECSFELEELADLTDNGKLDLYILIYAMGRKVQQRVRFHSNMKKIHFVDEQTKRKYSVIKTKKNNVTIISNKTSFNEQVTELKVLGSNFYIGGTIEDLDNLQPKHAELIFQRRDNRIHIGFILDLIKQETSNYCYQGIIYLDKLKNEMIVNSRWDVLIQLRDAKQNVVYRDLINLQSYHDFEREEERYIAQIQTGEDKITTLYATMGLNSLALWHTDVNQFGRTYQIAKGKTVFNQVAETQPLNEKMVFFESFLGKNYSGNPKYIYEQMINMHEFNGFTFVWSYSGEDTSVIPGNPKIVNRDSMEYYEYLAKSKYWVSNIIFPVQKKREGNIYLQTWHGTPLKKLGFDIEIDGPETLARENFYIESRNWDYLIAANNYSSNIFKRAFKFDKHMFEVGYPANDLFYRNREELNKIHHKIKRNIGIPEGKKILLYAPTWRDDEMTGSWDHTFELKFDLNRFYENLKDDYVLVLRMHHLVGDNMEIDDRFKNFVYDCSKYDDIQELYSISDVLITDYSSVFFDFANTKKPILFYAYDFKKYKDEIRGFYLDMKKDLPGPVLENDKDLLDAIININQIKTTYKKKYEEFHELYCGIEDGKASKKIIEKVFQR
jgi:CDP-glycerol glycerophosphotransferase (TagB/SpsB family)